MKDSFKIKKYVKELVIDKIVYIDIPWVFEIEEPLLLQGLMAISFLLAKTETFKYHCLLMYSYDY